MYKIHILYWYERIDLSIYEMMVYDMTTVCGFFNTATVTTSLRTFTVAPEASMMELTCGFLHHEVTCVNYI